MKLKFYKYQGTGNDFVIIDNRDEQIKRNQNDLFKHACDRRFGIGADGFIMLQNHPDYDFEMVYYNSDGNESSMCGNGGRCIVRFAHNLGVIGDKTKFLAIDGEHEAIVDGDVIRLKMGDVDSVEVGDDFIFLDTGSPHYVKIINDVKALDIIPEAHAIRYNDRFKAQGTNVNFIQPTADVLNVRTYERGVEDETLSCGTGVTASAIANHVNNGFTAGSFTQNINTPGGKLTIEFTVDTEQKVNNIWLIGPAEQVFAGEISI